MHLNIRNTCYMAPPTALHRTGAGIARVHHAYSTIVRENHSFSRTLGEKFSRKSNLSFFPFTSFFLFFFFFPFFLGSVLKKRSRKIVAISRKIILKRLLRRDQSPDSVPNENDPCNSFFPQNLISDLISISV